MPAHEIKVKQSEFHWNR